MSNEVVTPDGSPEPMVPCDGCGTEIPKAAAATSPSGEDFCAVCVEVERCACAQCGTDCWQEESQASPNGSPLCPDCFDEACYVCTECASTAWRSECRLTPDDEVVCEECFSERCTYCRLCDTVLWQNHSNVADGMDFCESCFDDTYFYCEYCSEVTHREDGYDVPNYGGIACLSCWEMRHYLCPDCGQTAERDSEHTCGRSPGGATSDAGTRVRILSYSTKPTIRPFTEYVENQRVSPDWTPKEVLFGVELEMVAEGQDTRLLSAPALAAAMNRPWLYCKSDASLGVAGIEAVTHPMSWRWIRKHKQELGEWLYALQAARMTAQPYCGMHIHIGRWLCTPSHLYKMARLVYQYPATMESLSGRAEAGALSRYATLRVEPEIWRQQVFYNVCRAAPLRMSRASLQARLRDIGDTMGRYVGLNMPAGAPTVELRFFAATLSPTRFFANLQFAKALWEYTREASLREVTLLNLRRWVLARKSAYPELSIIL